VPVIDIPAKRLTIEQAQAVARPTEIAVLDRETGSLVERVLLLRYGGHYRSGSTHAFAVKDLEGKFRVRSARSLGLTDDSSRVAVFAAEIDLTQA
jgi:hypothetical protein